MCASLFDIGPLSNPADSQIVGGQMLCVFYSKSYDYAHNWQMVPTRPVQSGVFRIKLLLPILNHHAF